MSIMTRVGQKVMDVLGDSNDWVRGLHCKCDVDPEKRWICQFPEDNTIISVNSAYGGNVLLGKKCFALRIASYQAKNEGWMAEHMLILGVENPKGEVKYVCAAFPSLAARQPGYDDSAGRLPCKGLQGLDRRRRHRLDAQGPGWQTVCHQPGKRLLRCRLPART